jgi:hypothetical protein
MARADYQQLISESYSRDEGWRYASFRPNSTARSVVQQLGRQALGLEANRLPGQCVALNVILVALLRDKTEYPVHLIAGDLKLFDRTIFRCDSTPYDSAKSADQIWDGHCWVVFGDEIGDISICRTAKSGKADPGLKPCIEFIERTVGSTNAGLILATPESFAEVGLNYVPKFALDDDEISYHYNAALVQLGISNQS